MPIIPPNTVMVLAPHDIQDNFKNLSSICISHSLHPINTKPLYLESSISIGAISFSPWGRMKKYFRSGNYNNISAYIFNDE